MIWTASGKKKNSGGRPLLGLESLQLNQICRLGTIRKSCRKPQTSARSKESGDSDEFDLALLCPWRKAERNWRRWRREERENGARVFEGAGRAK